jgi:hypothetical protein
LEPTNIGGGRADIKLRSGNERLVVEVKRELTDCSFDALSRKKLVEQPDVGLGKSSLQIILERIYP